MISAGICLVGFALAGAPWWVVLSCAIIGVIAGLVEHAIKKAC